MMDHLKMQAALRALELVQDGMTLGLGSGSTSAFFVDLLGEKFRSGALQDIRGVPTSESTAQRASAWGIPLISLSSIQSAGEPYFDLAIDGADEVDPDLNLIKGLGRALLREKIIEMHARRFVIIVEESKLVSRLGSRGPLPVELVQFEADVQMGWLNGLGCRAELWREDDGSLVITDNGNFLARCWFDGGIPNAYALARVLSDRPGIVEHGLFLDMAHEVIVAGEGGVRMIEKGQRSSGIMSPTQP